jgi:hypothetical protein
VVVDGNVGRQGPYLRRRRKDPIQPRRMESSS